MTSSYVDHLFWLTQHTAAIVGACPMPAYNPPIRELHYNPLELSGLLHDIATKTEDQEDANVIDAAAIMLLNKELEIDTLKDLMKEMASLT